MATPELSVVIPAFNEEEAIGRVVMDWTVELDGLGVDYELLVYDDGSRDRTSEVLADLGTRLPRLHAVSQPNRGHGPTILRGYGEASGQWVAQCDGDDEIAAAAFSSLWQRRGDFDFALGRRSGRRSPLDRRLVSLGSRCAVRALFGRGLFDVNTPFRLMLAAPLRELLTLLPMDTFAPNVILAGLAVRRGLKVCEVPVPFRGRRSGEVSLVSGKLWRAAARALRQTITIARRSRGGES